MGTETIYCTITALLLASVVATKAITVRLLMSGQDNIKDLQFELMQRRESLRKSQKENKVALQKERSLKYKRKALMKKVDPLKLQVEAFEKEESLRHIYEPMDGEEMRAQVA